MLHSQLNMKYSVFANCMEISPFCGKGSLEQNRDVILLEKFLCVDILSSELRQDYYSSSISFSYNYECDFAYIRYGSGLP